MRIKIKSIIFLNIFTIFYCISIFASLTGCGLRFSKKDQNPKNVQKALQYLKQGNIEYACDEYKKAFIKNPKIDSILKGLAKGAYDNGLKAYNNKNYDLACEKFCTSLICTPPNQTNPLIGDELVGTEKIHSEKNASDILSEYYDNDFSCPRLVLLFNKFDSIKKGQIIKIPKIKDISCKPKILKPKVPKKHSKEYKVQILKPKKEKNVIKNLINDKCSEIKP